MKAPMLQQIANVISWMLPLAAIAVTASEIPPDLSTFDVPPCCFAPVGLGLDPRNQLAESRSEESTSASTPNETTASVFASKMQRFMFRMDESNSTSRSSGNHVHEILGKNRTVTKVKRRKLKTTTATTPMEQRLIQFDSVNETLALPTTEFWNQKLRHVLYQSMSNSSTIPWSNIYSAPMEFVDPRTRKLVAAKDSPIAPEETGRISGIMVNSKNGIEIRTTAANVIGAASKESPIASGSSQSSSNCNCHLVNHGDTVLAYWTIGFSPVENSLEYLVYPVTYENVPFPPPQERLPPPTAPIYEPFHVQKQISRPSPIDLNPWIGEGSNINEIPFQASLDFGVGKSGRFLAPGPQIPPLPQPHQHHHHHYHKEFYIKEKRIPVPVPVPQNLYLPPHLGPPPQNFQIPPRLPPPQDFPISAQGPIAPPRLPPQDFPISAQVPIPPPRLPPPDFQGQPRPRPQDFTNSPIPPQGGQFPPPRFPDSPFNGVRQGPFPAQDFPNSIQEILYPHPPQSQNFYNNQNDNEIVQDYDPRDRNRNRGQRISNGNSLDRDRDRKRYTGTGATTGSFRGKAEYYYGNADDRFRTNLQRYAASEPGSGSHSMTNPRKKNFPYPTATSKTKFQESQSRNPKPEIGTNKSYILNF